MHRIQMQISTTFPVRMYQLIIFFKLFSNTIFGSLKTSPKLVQTSPNFFLNKVQNYIICKGDVTRYDSQRRFLAQRSASMLEQ